MSKLKNPIQAVTCLVGATITSLLGCVGGGEVKGDIIARFDGENALVFVVPSRSGALIKRFDFPNGATTTLGSVEGRVFSSVSAANNEIFVQASSSTPKGRPTNQIFRFAKESSQLVQVFPPEESSRSDLMAVGGAPIYLKKNSWHGAFGGMPWGEPFQVCQLTGGKEEVLAEFDGPVVMPDSSPISLPIPVLVLRDRYDLSLVDRYGAPVRKVASFDNASYPSISTEGERVALGTFGGKWKGDVILEVSVSTGEVISVYSQPGRLTGLFYGPSGKLFCTTGEDGVRSAILWVLEKGESKRVATLE